MTHIMKSIQKIIKQVITFCLVKIIYIFTFVLSVVEKYANTHEKNQVIYTNTRSLRLKLFLESRNSILFTSVNRNLRYSVAIWSLFANITNISNILGLDRLDENI
jgi:hypothetical protein